MVTTSVNVSQRTCNWSTVKWRKANRIVRNLRQRIFKAAQENNLKKVRRLQRLLLRCYSNILLAVRRVTQTNAGKHTPGVDKREVRSPIHVQYPRVGYAASNIINLLVHLQTDLSIYDFSHLTIWQAYLQGVNLQQVNFAYSDLDKSVFSQSLGSIFSVAFSPDQNLLATGGTDGQIRIWQVSDGKQIVAWQAHGDWIRSVVFSHDGKMIASGSNDRTVKVWNSQTGDFIPVESDQ